MRNLRSSFVALSMAFPHILIDFQSISVTVNHFQSFSITFGHFQSFSITLTLSKTQELSDNREVGEKHLMSLGRAENAHASCL